MVVVFPLPVGPVMRMIHFSERASSRRYGASPILSADGITLGIIRNVRLIHLRICERFTRKRVSRYSNEISSVRSVKGRERRIAHISFISSFDTTSNSVICTISHISFLTYGELFGVIWRSKNCLSITLSMSVRNLVSSIIGGESFRVSEF